VKVFSIVEVVLSWLGSGPKHLGSEGIEGGAGPHESSRLKTGILLPNKQRQHIQQDVLPYVLC